VKEISFSDELRTNEGKVACERESRLAARIVEGKGEVSVGETNMTNSEMSQDISFSEGCTD